MNLSSITNIATAATSLSNLILVSPQKTIGYQPQNADGSTSQQPPALLFHYEGEQTVALESDITDHYVEDNTAIQDQVALKPEIITTHGFIGELNNVKPKALGLLNDIANRLQVVDAFVPGLSKTAINAVNTASQLYSTASNVANSAVSTWSSITGQDGENVIGTNGLGAAFNVATGEVKNNQTKQQIAFQQFYGYWRARTLFTIQTPWAVFQNMAIKSLRAIQDPDTRVITDFEVSFKMMRFAQVKTANGVAALLQGRAATMAAGLVDLGTSTPKPSISLSQGLSRLVG